MSNNPYESPHEAQSNFQQDAMVSIPAQTDPGMTRHVPLIAVFMIVQGVLCAIMSLVYFGYAAFFPVMIRAMEEGMPEAQQGSEPPEAVFWMMSGFMALLGLPVLAAGVLQIWAGIRNYKYRSRMLGIVALVSNAGAILTCYCAPTGIALMVYGLIVYLNPPVIRAFEMGEQGLSREQIDAAFSPAGLSPFASGQAPPPKV